LIIFDCRLKIRDYFVGLRLDYLENVINYCRNDAGINKMVLLLFEQHTDNPASRIVSLVHDTKSPFVGRFMACLTRSHRFLAISLASVGSRLLRDF
jgi:hypothetical protein